MNLNSTNVTRYRFATWNWIARARRCAEIQTRRCGSRVRKRKRRESNDVFGHSRRSFRIRQGEFADGEARNVLQFGLANSRRCASVGFAISRWQSNERINATRNTACQPGLLPVRTRTANRSLASFAGVKTRDRAASCSLGRVMARSGSFAASTRVSGMHQSAKDITCARNAAGIVSRQLALPCVSSCIYPAATPPDITRDD